MMPPELAREAFPEVLKLAAQGRGPVSIARQLSAVYQLSISPGTVRHWIVGDRKPGIDAGVRNVFREESSPALSYIIGANKGDGCTLAKSDIVKLEVTDVDFAQAFNVNMATLFSRSKSNKIFVRRRAGRLPMYIVKYACRQLVQFLRQPLKKLFELALAFPCEFLRGFFDAEGHVDVSAEHEFHLRVGAENSNKDLLSRVERVLMGVFGTTPRINQKRKAGTNMIIRGEKFTKRKTSFSLLMSRTKDVESFAARVGFSISRKQEKLDDALGVVRSYRWKDRSAAWKVLYSKRRGEWIKRTNNTRPAQK